ncbi:hypothetical protein QQX98_008536 [Neonectria punicea]|uniref:Uncharacterized protein n=1 Tax=Neonectria punicea TaxID=979145 RepID=A0ABR1GUV4_9HYPO
MASATLGKLPSRPTSWKLDLPFSTQDAETALLAIDGFQKEAESIIQRDDLAPVDVSARRDGGLSRIISAIVKIEARFENKVTGHSIWKIGTGLLIRPDVVVTSGDVVYDTEYQLGATTQVKCYIGYRGRTSSVKSQIQSRHSRYVVTSAEWIDESDQRSRDLAFVQVAEPFDIEICTCKALEDVDIKEPEPVPVEDEPVVPEVGEKLIVTVTRCTGCGSSSDDPVVAPVEQPEPVKEPEPVEEPAPVEEPEVQEEPVTEDDPITAPSVNTEADTDFEVVDEHTPTTSVDANTDPDPFYEMLKTVASVDAESLDADSPLLGPASHSVSVAAGALLSYVVGAEAISSGASTKIAGAAERALLAEAALEAVLAIEESPELDEILEHMKKNWTDNAPDVDQVAGIFASYLTEASRDIIAYHLEDSEEQVGKSKHKRRALAIRHFSTTGATQDFIKGLFGPTLPLAGREDVFSSLGPVLRSALSAVEQLVSPSAKTAVSDRVAKLLQKIALGGPGLTPVSAGPNEEATRLLLQRAVMADAALQAIISLSKEKLDALKLIPLDSETNEVEAIFDFLKRVIQKAGPIALHPTKLIVRKFAALLIDAPPKAPTQPVKQVTLKTPTNKVALRDMLRGAKGSVRLQKEQSPKTIINITTGTLHQARSMENWLKAHGIAEYLDGAIVVTPELVGTEHSAIWLSSETEGTFSKIVHIMSVLGKSYYSGDPGAACLWDIAFLSAMDSMLTGGLMAMNLLKM